MYRVPNTPPVSHSLLLSSVYRREGAFTSLYVPVVMFPICHMQPLLFLPSETTCSVSAKNQKHDDWLGQRDGQGKWLCFYSFRVNGCASPPAHTIEATKSTS